LKPAASTPAGVTEPNSKSGTTIVKSAPPKETARITVKPNLPQAAVRAGNFPTAKPVPGAVPVAVAAGAAVGAAVAAKAVAKPTVKAADAPKPATTIVKTAAAPKVAAASVKPSAATVPVPAMPAQFQDEASTTMTTALAGVLAGLTWGTAIILGLNLAGVF
jgi:hypothetical protein